MTIVSVVADAAALVGAVDCMAAAKAVMRCCCEEALPLGLDGQRALVGGDVREDPDMAAEAREVLRAVQPFFSEVQLALPGENLLLFGSDLAGEAPSHFRISTERERDGVVLADRLWGRKKGT